MKRDWYCDGRFTVTPQRTPYHDRLEWLARMRYSLRSLRLRLRRVNRKNPARSGSARTGAPRRAYPDVYRAIEALPAGWWLSVKARKHNELELLSASLIAFRNRWSGGDALAVPVGDVKMQWRQEKRLIVQRAEHAAGIRSVPVEAPQEAPQSSTPAVEAPASAPAGEIAPRLVPADASLLETLEWSYALPQWTNGVFSTVPACPVCHKPQRQGHIPTCELGRRLR